MEIVAFGVGAVSLLISLWWWWRCWEFMTHVEHQTEAMAKQVAALNAQTAQIVALGVKQAAALERLSSQ